MIRITKCWIVAARAQMDVFLRQFVASAIAGAVWMPLGTPASQLEEALDAGETGTNYLEGALTGLYQNATDAGEDTGSYEVDLIGSIVLKKRGNNWFIQGGFSDAKAESEFDFDSLGDGVFAWTAELGWAPRMTPGETAVSVLIFRVDETPTLTRQDGWAMAACSGSSRLCNCYVIGKANLKSFWG